MFALVITGPPGAGKSSVVTALADALSDDDVRHAAVEAESLRWAHPALSDEQEMRHIRVMCSMFRDAGHDFIVVGQTIEHDDDLARLVDAVDADEAFVVRLEAHPDTLVARIIAREPAGWSGLAGLLDHARLLAARTPRPGTVDLVLNTEAEQPEVVAQRIRAALPESVPGRRRHP